jgi:hypothetical protein
MKCAPLAESMEIDVAALETRDQGRFLKVNP